MKKFNLESVPPILKSEAALWGLFIVIGLLAATLTMGKSALPEVKSGSDISSLETLIPRDHLLVPVEITNADRLDGVLGANGIVDLYQAGKGLPMKLVGRRLRLLRAPLNPNSFAVLLRESEADRFLSTPGPYVASVRPLEEKMHEIARPTQPTPRIEYSKE